MIFNHLADIESEYNFYTSGVDLALLSYSNHSIISYGSFSMWGALLSRNGGEVIMPIDYGLTDVGERINMTNIPNWTFI